MPGPRVILRALARRLLPRAARAAVAGLPRVLPLHWRYRGAFARACLAAMGVRKWARLTPLQQTYVDFALSTNDRGRWAAGLIQRARDIRGTRCLDIGCAYGGFLVALGERGARELVGIDVEARLLDLARVNLAEHGIPATIELADIEDPATVVRLGRFDVVVLNDVLEHVSRPARTIEHACRLLGPGGLVFALLPNKYFVRYLLHDGHYRLPGLTLLAHRQAEAYYRSANPAGGPYTVGQFRTLAYYRHHFRRWGLDVELARTGLGVYDLDQLHAEFAGARAFFDGFADPRLPPALGARVRRRGAAVCAAFETLWRRHEALRREGLPEAAAVADRILVRYGMEAWCLIATRP